MKTNFALNTLNNIIIFFKSIIGPYTKKASMEEVGNKFRKEAPMKASASEHSDKKKASPIITVVEPTTPSPKRIRILRIHKFVQRQQ